MDAKDVRNLLLVLGVCLACSNAASAQITSGAATGEIDFTVNPFGSQLNTGTQPIPQAPGNLSLGPFGIRGSSGFLPITWNFNANEGFAYIAGTVLTPFLNQEADAAAAAGAGLAI
jgi:hypothetical protein